MPSRGRDGNLRGGPPPAWPFTGGKNQLMATHKCIKQTNKKLKNKNTVLVSNILNPNHIFVATERIRRLRDGKKPVSVVAAFCPFCGEKLEGT